MKMTLKRMVSFLLALSMCLIMLPAVAMQAEAAYDNTHTNTGNQAYDIVAVAQTQIGYQEGTNNYNKYSAAFGANNVEWCAYFVSWCAKEAGISDSIIHRQGIASPFSGYFNIPNTHSSGNYFPKPGDLVFYGPNSNGDHYHVGIVETVNASTGYITTIEGNTNSSGSSTGYIVYRHTRHYQHSTICCYGRPNYTNTSVKHTVDTSYGTKFTAYPKAKITAEKIFDAYHSQIDSTSWIGTSDKCTIHEVYTDGCCKVTYPLDAGGTKTVYSKISLFNTHTHSYTGSRYYESAHPHAITQRCVNYDTCGGWIYTGEYYEVKTCEQCWHADFDIGASSVSVKVGESKTVAVSVGGCLPDSAVAYPSFSPDNDVVEVTIKNQQATFTGLKEGTTLFQIRIYSDSSKSYLIGATSIRVDVATPTYTIVYNANGGSGAPGSQTKYYNTTLTLSSTKPTRTGYTFLGWSTSSTATSATYQPGGSFTSNANTTLYAVWKKGCEGSNHKFVYDVTGRPTSTSTGKIVGKCGYCGTTTSVLLPKLNTNDYTYKVTKAATCTATGMGRYTWNTTTYGGSYYFDAAIPATGHSYSYKATKNPTTSATGALTGTCTKCSGTTTVTLPKLTTTDYSYAVTKAATCTATGTGRYTWKTTTYGGFYFDVSIPATGHSYTSKVTVPTCTAQGYTTYTCSCGHSYKDGYTNATGHAYVSASSFECENCGEIRNAVSLSVAVLPTILEYIWETDKLDVNGGTLMFTHADGSKGKVRMTTDMVSGFDNTELGVQELTVTYGGCTTTYSVEIIKGYAEKLRLEQLPTITSYVAGQELDISGLAVRLYYKHGTSEILALTDLSIDPVDMTTAGSKAVTVRYQELSTSFNIQVHEYYDTILDSSLYPESSHDYDEMTNETKTFTWPGAEELTLTFSAKSATEADFDFVYLYNGNGGLIGKYSGRLANKTVTVIGDTFTIKLVSDDMICNYGYSFASIRAKGIKHTYEQNSCTVCGLRETLANGYVNGSYTSYTDLESAIAASSWVKLCTNTSVNVPLTKDMYIDLNGYDLAGTIATNGYKIYGMDSTTDSYSCEVIGYFNCVDENGNAIVPVTHFKSDITGETKRYMAIKDDNGYSFHRFYLGITHQSLKPTTAGVGYKGVFYGDSMVAANLDSFGFTMQLGNYSPKAITKTGGFVSGKTVTLRIDNFDVENYGETELFASATLKLSDGTVIESTRCVMTLRSLLETLNENHATLNTDQLKLVADFIKKYAIIQSWKVENLL